MAKKDYLSLSGLSILVDEIKAYVMSLVNSKSQVQIDIWEADD